MSVVIVTDTDITERQRERAEYLEQLIDWTLADLMARYKFVVDDELSGPNFTVMPINQICSMANVILSSLHKNQKGESRQYRFQLHEVNRSHIKIVNYGPDAAYVCFEMFEIDDISFTSDTWYLNLLAMGKAA